LKDTLPHYHARRRAITLAPVFSTTPSPFENALARSADDVIDLTTGADETWLPVECSRQFTSGSLGGETISLVLGSGTSDEPLGDSRTSSNAVEKVPATFTAQTPEAQTPEAQTPEAQTPEAQTSTAQISPAQTDPAQTNPAQTDPDQTSTGQTTLRSASVAGLVEKAREGDGGAWAELVARFGGMIAATGRRYRLPPADVAELQQTTWLRLVENLHRIEQPERVGGWLATTARRESLQLLRRAAKYRSGADQMLANMPDRHLPEPDARPIAEERETVLRAAWDQLKPRCQELLALLITDDPLGYKDLSKLLEMPVGSIGPTRARCLEHLRRLVEEEGMAGI
jgi:RNA polymerase sigma factor (sigma-70 family)